jgi:hypothetical protein
MIVLIVAEEDEAALEDLNALNMERQLTPALLVDGRKALNADLLEDCGEGQTWERYEQFLGGLEIEEVEPSEFETSELS